jgi:molecular chaperone GrpE
LSGSEGEKRVSHKKTSTHHKSEHNTDTGHARRIEISSEEQADNKPAAENTAEKVEGAGLPADDLKSRLEQIEKEKQDLYDRVLRTTADFDNFRKRVSREKDELIRYGNEKLARELLPVIDNFERALGQAENSADNKALREGIEMILKQFIAVLEKFGVKYFTSVGQPFDPNKHEAMVHQESGEHEENAVISEFQKGYYLHEKLLRPSLVAVAKKPAEICEAEDSSPDVTIH